MGLVARVAEHLWRQQGPVCDACLAADLALDAPRTRRALTRLGKILDISRRRATCARCGETGLVSDGPLRPGAPEVRVVALLERRPADRVCHRCLAEGLGVRLGEVREAVAVLRARGACGIYAGICSECRRTRVLVGLA